MTTTDARPTREAVDADPVVIASPENALLRRALVGVTVLFVCAVFVPCALTYGRSLRTTAEPVGFHAAAADALLRGDAAVQAAPPGLLALSDPFDPVANVEFRAAGAHDYALYNGNLYTTTGPTTAIVLYVPSRLLGLGNMNPNLATLLGVVGAFVAAVGIYLECRRRFFPTISPLLEVLIIVTIGLGSPLPWLVSVGRAYESAIACGLLCVMAAGYFLLRALRNPARPSRIWLAGAGAAFAAAVGARVDMALTVVFVGAAVVVILRAARRQNRSPRSSLLWLLLPFVAVAAFIALYNYVRFDSFTEFGTNFQLAGTNTQTYDFYNLSYVTPNLVDYLLLKPLWQHDWPFVHLQKNTFHDDPFHHAHEPIAGVLLLFPIILTGFAIAGMRLRRMIERERALAVGLGLVLAFALAIVLGVALPFNASTMRYTVDFAPVLVLAAAVGGAWAISASGATLVMRRVLTVAFAAAAAVSIATGVALVLTPCPGTGSC